MVVVSFFKLFCFLICMMVLVILKGWVISIDEYFYSSLFSIFLIVCIIDGEGLVM